MSEPREPMRRVVVAGAGQVGVLTAIGLRRALPACEVVVLGLPIDPAAFADHATTALPFTNTLHDRLGIDEGRLVLAAGGSHRLAVRYFGWGGEGQNGVLTYGGSSDPALHSRFAQQWGAGGRNVSGDRPAGSLAEVLADAGRFAPPAPGSESPIAKIEYAMRWNVPAYRNLLVGIAHQLGVAHVQGEIEAIEPDGQGGIAALSIEGQGRIEADLFVDCSGPAALLVSAMPQFESLDWNETLPIRRVLVAPPGQAMLALEDRVSLVPEGWLSELAGRDGLQRCLAVGEGVGDQTALRALGADPVADIAVSPGSLRAPWMGNVVALGDAAARFEPLGGLSLDLAHRQLALLLEMLPGRAIVAHERSEFNRRMAQMADGVRDTLAMHYAAPRAAEIYSQVRPTESVNTALDQFSRRGRLPFREEAPFLKQEQIALLGALGFAQGIGLQHRAIDQRQIDAAQADFAAHARAALESAPPYQQWMESVLAARTA